ncbi:MAG TPA: PRTRC system protein C [Ramlibacter sp.]|jgi:PRTRC genetic system protein C|nr:PRTRC system protein C [Ramlibacter sp.]
MQEIPIVRAFRYNSITLPDPNPALGPDQVREFYASQYPELNNAVVEGPVTRNATSTYTFLRAAGAKGADQQARSARECLQQALSRKRGSDTELLEQALAHADDPAMQVLAEVATAPTGGAAALPLPSAAFGLWG